MGDHAYRKDDQVEFLIMKTIGLIDKGNEQIMGQGVFSYPGNQTADVTDPVPFLGLFDIAVKTFSLGPQINKKDSRFDRRQMLFGNNGLLGGGHTADRGAIILMDRRIPGPDALNPGYFPWFLSIRKPLDMPHKGTGGRKDPFKFQTGQNIGIPSITIFTFKAGIKDLKTRRQDNGSDLQSNLFSFHGMINGPGLADLQALITLGAHTANQAAGRLFSRFFLGHDPDHYLKMKAPHFRSSSSSEH